MQVKCKVWLEEEQVVLGEGLWLLLKNVERFGSLRQAALSLGMSYRQAWGKIKKAEEVMHIKFLIREIGGKGGGGAYLTLEGKEFVEKYGSLREEVKAAATKIFSGVFR